MSKREPYEFAAPKVTGPQYWRSLEERAKRNDPELRKELAAEFPPGHTSTPASEESSNVSRRSFLSLVSASLALSGLAACRRPVEHILPVHEAQDPTYLRPGHWKAGPRLDSF